VSCRAITAHTLLVPALLGCGAALARSQQPSLTVQQQVSVTATRTSVPDSETAKTIYTLDAAQLHDSSALTLDESLRQHAGFELFRRAPSRIANPTSEGISLRGLGSTAASRTLVLEDGWIHWNENPQQTISAVELVTGGGSDLYGSSALGGVIDVLPESPEGPANLAFAAAGGSQQTENVQGSANYAVRRTAGLLAGESLRTGGYVTTDPAIAGAVDLPANVRSQAYRTELERTDHDAGRAFLTGNLLSEDRSNGTPLQTNATRLWRYLGGYDSPADHGPAEGRLRLFGSDEGYRQSFSSIAADRNSETLTRLQRVHTQELGASTDATVHTSRFVMVGGADVRDIRAEDNETPIVKGLPNGRADVSARQRFIGGFGEVLGQAGRWSAALSLRADRASNLDVVQSTATTVTSSPNRTEVVLSPRLGLVRNIGGAASLHASVFRAFRTPTMNELYRTGQVGSQTTLANGTLSSERGTGFEFGGQSQMLSGRLELQATYFWTEINRPVSTVLLTQTATASTLMRENLGQIRSEGVEAGATFHAGKAVTLAAGYQFADAVVTRFSAQPALVGLWIPQVPRQSFTAQVRAASRRVGELTLAARATGKAFDDSNNQYPLAGFFELDLSGRRTLGKRLAGGRLEAFFLVQNLTGQRQQVARTPILTLGTPLFGEAGLRFWLDRGSAVTASPAANGR
jgi:outer membrane receptor protein involved in Fe transport